MNSMRKILGFLFAILALGAFVSPAFADSGDQYRVNFPTSNVATGVQFNVTITNRAGFDTLKSFKINAPSGVSVTAVASGSSNIPVSKISNVGGTISVSNIAIYNNQSGTLKITATFPVSCAAQNLAWTSSALGGFLVSNEVFSLDAANSNQTTNVAAGACNYTFTTSPAGVPAGASTSMTATVANAASSSGPSLTGFVLTAPAGLNITGATGPSGTVMFTSTAITVTGVSVAGGANYPVSVTVAPAPSCTDSGGPWTSSVTPATFTLSGGNPTTSITKQACTMSVTWPTSLSVSPVSPSTPGTPFSVTAQLAGGLPAGISVGITTGGCPNLSGMTSALTDGTGKAVIGPMTIAGTGGTCTLTATPGDTHYLPEPQSKVFTVFGATVGCDAASNFVSNVPGMTLNPNGSDAPVGSTGWGLTRSQNSDGTCNMVNLTCTVASNRADCAYDKSSSETPALKYLVLWDPVPVDSSGATTGWKQFRPQVSWIQNPSTDSSSPDWVPALACVEDITVTASTVKADVVAVMPNLPNDCSPSTPSPADGPFCKASTAHPADYALGGPAKMCISQQGRTSIGIVGGNINVQYFDKVIDVSDGHIVGP